MSREEFYSSNRGEREYYVQTMDEEIMLPLTYDGFEALVLMLSLEYELPIDNRLRSLVAGYIHHIPSDEISTNFQKMAKAVYKSFSNSMTYEVDQKAKAEEVAKARAKIELVEPSKEQTPPINNA